MKGSEFTSIITQKIKSMPGKYLNHDANLLYIRHIMPHRVSPEENLSAWDYSSATVFITLKLELYDMVQVKKNYGSADSCEKNYFEGHMLG